MAIKVIVWVENVHEQNDEKVQKNRVKIVPSAKNTKFAQYEHIFQKQQLIFFITPIMV